MNRSSPDHHRLPTAMRLASIPLAAALVAAACSADRAPSAPEARDGDDEGLGGASAGEGIVAARLIAGGLEVGNDRAAPIGYVPIEQGSLALVDWAPCAIATDCPTVAPGETRVVPYDRIAGWAPGGRAVVLHWWHLVRGRDGELRPDDVRTLTVRR